MNHIFEMQADLNDFTFLENECYLYTKKDLTDPNSFEKGTFRDLCKHILEKNMEIKAVRLPNSKNGLWKIIESEKSWEDIQGWWLNAYNLALKQEAAELIDSTNWKWWRTKVDKFNEQNLRVEIIDQLHFWVSLCMIAGMGFEKVDEIYKSKNEVNIQRQKSGYLVKDENDCKHI